MKNNVICQKKISGFMRYISALFLVFGMVLLMRMDVNAEDEKTVVEVNTPYFVENLVDKEMRFTVPSSGRVRFCFDHCVDPKKVSESCYYYDNYIWNWNHWQSASWKIELENSNSNWFEVESGDYYSKIEHTTVNSEATFTVQYEPRENYNGEIEPNDTMNSAMEIETNKQYWGNLLINYDGYRTDNRDYYHFTLTKPSKVDFSFVDTWKNSSERISGLYQEDQKGNTKEIGDFDCPKTMRLEAGSYYIEIGNLWYSDEHSILEYTLMVNATEESASEYEIEKNNLQSQANEKELNKNYTGNINQSGIYDGEDDIDWFKFAVSEKSYLKLELTVPKQAEGSVTAQFYKDSEEILSLKSGSNPYIESDEQIFSPGTYYVCVSGDSWAEWDYKICLSQRKFVEVTGIDLISQKSLKVGESEVLSAVVKPDNASEKAVKWSSSDSSVVSIDQTGKVTAKKGGIVVITAQATDDSGIKAVCEITVLVGVKEIKLDSQMYLKRGETTTLSAVVKPSDASEKTLNWSSSNESVVSVDQTGKVTANKGGAAIITAQAVDGSGIEAVCGITVLVDVEEIELDSQRTLRKGEKVAFSAVVKPNDASEKALKWSSSNESVASVNGIGEVKAKKEGKAVIKAQATDGSGIKAVCKVTVLTGVKRIKLVSQKALGVGGSTILSAVVKPDSASEKTVKWSSSNKNVASVDQTGKVKAKKKGTAVITAKATDGSGVEASCRITVQAGVKSIRLPAEKTMKSGETMALSAVVKPDKAFNKTLNWSSSNTQVATVDAKGRVTARKSGTTVITAQAADGNTVKASCKLTVTVGTAEAKEIYSDYYYENLIYNSKYPENRCILYDINQDGIPEMFLEYAAGVRAGYNIYTLEGSKIKLILAQTGIGSVGYNAGKKQIYIHGSSGADSGCDTVYELKGIKLKKITEYKYNSGYYYKDGKRISESQMQTIWKDLNKWPYL